MRLQKAIDMTRPAALYLLAIGVLLLSVFIEGRGGVVLFSRFGALRFQKTIAVLFIIASVLFGLLGARRYEARALEPWRVPQVQVLLCFVMFFILGLLGIGFSS